MLKEFCAAIQCGRHHGKANCEGLMNIKTLVLFFGIWIGAGLMFWFWEGNTMKYDVYSAATYRYSEDFSTTGRVLISSLIGLVASTVFLLIRWFISYVAKRVESNVKTES